ncbi:MAG: GAF domain-containing protein [Flavobacteriaceae bacterium]|nr:GAF domain-containing protein [Flavobacteriaceae bacterium]
MKNENPISPFKIVLSFDSLISEYEKQLENEQNHVTKDYINGLLSYVKNYPTLATGIYSEKELNDYKEPIRLLLSDLFPRTLTKNEIKVATVPLKNLFFFQTERFQSILEAAGEEYFPEMGIEDDLIYIMSCTWILGKVYGKPIDLKRPLYFKIPDATGVIKTYKLAINADFTDIKPTKNAREITENDIDELLQDFDNLDLWKKKFPPESWELKGFTIINLIDVTIDTVISDLKSNLLDHTPNTNNNFDDFEANFKKLYNNIDLNVGFTLFEKSNGTLMTRPEKETNSYMLGNHQLKVCSEHMCEGAHSTLFEKKELFALADVDDYAAKTRNNPLSKALLENNIKSCIFAPIVYQDELLGILEIVSSKKNELNAANAHKLQDILPYIVTTAKRANDLAENQIKAVIQNECTSIHPTVLWKFDEEAQQFLTSKAEGKDAIFNDIAFDYVFPLFGQIDIKGSSTARNNAIQADFIEQLDLVKNIFCKVKETENLPFYDHIIFRINEFSIDMKQSFNTASEESLLHFLSREINPIMPHIQNLSEELKQLVNNYYNKINPQTGIIYHKRKDYETTVQTINEQMASIIDKKQEEAQAIFPHFFERFKTDGVEHNIYIGQSLVKDKQFNKVYLNNLRLWQLTTMCEMENDFYELQKELPMSLDCASLLLVFSNSLSIRYRIDEKKFDVDGSYNARYEIIKKRIDKAHIKGTDERITQKGKLVIVYSQKKDELEYMRYLNYLQSKNYLENDIEVLDLEDLQGVVGLKALRVSITYNSQNKVASITYGDLMKEIEKN